MSRRLMFYRASNPDDVLSATTEAGLESDTPGESSVNGQLELYAGGTPAIDEAYNIDVLVSGNVGDAEFGFNAQGDSEFNGVCAPWIIDRASVDIDRNDPINVPHRMIRATDSSAICIYVAGTTPRYCAFSKSSRVWGAVKTVTAAGAVAAGSGANGWYFDDTGEAVIFCDGDLFSTFDTTDSASWILKGSLPTGSTFSGGASSTHITLIYARDRLILLFVEGNAIFAAVSYDRGSNWETDANVSADFEDAINQADSIHACVSPLDGNMYMIVEDDTSGAGNTDRLRLYRSSDGFEWVQVYGDVGAYFSVANTLKHASIMALQDGTLVIFVNVGGARIQAIWQRADGTSYFRSKGRGRDAATVLTCDNLESMEAIDLGHEVIGASMITDVGGATLDTLNGVPLRWWSNISEQATYDRFAWLNNQTAEPDSRWGWTAVGTASAAVPGNTYLTITTVPATAPSRYYEQSVGGDGNIGKLKFVAICSQNGDKANRRVGVKVLRENGAGKGFNLGFFFDETGWSLYDYQTAAEVSSGARDFTQFNEILIDIEFDAANGGASVTVWARFDSNGYPDDYWDRLTTGTIQQSAPHGAADGEVRWGNFSVAASNTISLWCFMLVGDEEEGADASYANTAADHSDLFGKRCATLAQEVTNDQFAWWRGAGGAVDDRWTFGARYLWEKENVLRADPSREWRSTADEAIVSIALFEHANRPYRPDCVALFGINFERFDIEADDASTFDSDGGSPEFAMHVGWGTLSGDDASGLIVPSCGIEQVDEDWIQATPANATQASLWKGRFDKNAIAGRRFFIRIIGAGGAPVGNVYRVESIEMIDDTGGASWQIRLAPNTDGTFPSLVVDGVSTSNNFGIFGDAIAIELPPTTFYRVTGYKYVRIKITSQKTWDGDYRIGHLMFGLSAPLGQPIGVAGQYIPRIADAEYGACLDTLPNVAALALPDGYAAKRRLGRAPRVVKLSWSGISGIDSWQNAVRSLLEAAHSDTPVAFMENEEFKHTGPVGPVGTPSRVCYDPILCYVEGTVSLSHQVYVPFSPRYGTADQRGMVSDIGGVRLREIV